MIEKMAQRKAAGATWLPPLCVRAYAVIALVPTDVWPMRMPSMDAGVLPIVFLATFPDQIRRIFQERTPLLGLERGEARQGGVIDETNVYARWCLIRQP